MIHTDGWTDDDSARVHGDDAGQLADLFSELALALDDFRLDEKIRARTTREQLVALKFLAQKLDDQAKILRTDAVLTLWPALEPEIRTIRAAAADAKVQFGLLNDPAAAIAIATAALSAGMSITAETATPAAVRLAADDFARAARVR